MSDAEILFLSQDQKRQHRSAPPGKRRNGIVTRLETREFDRESDFHDLSLVQTREYGVAQSAGGRWSRP